MRGFCSTVGAGRNLAGPAPLSGWRKKATLAVCMIPILVARPASPPGPTEGFTRLDPKRTGVTVSNVLTLRQESQNRILASGSGVAVGDANGDGRLDLYFGRLQGGNVLYLNRGGWRFEEVEEAGGARCLGQASTGVAFADADGDGDLDLLVNGIGAGTRLFLNDGKAGFAEKTDAGLDRTGGGTSMSLSDMDGDGDLDLYVTNYRTDTSRDAPPGLQVRVERGAQGEYKVTPPGRFIVVPGPDRANLVELGEEDALYRNRGNGSFEKIPWTGGYFLDASGQPLRDPPRDWGLSVMFRDLDGDGWPDLYVCNDFILSPDRLWRNRRGQGFQEATPLSIRSQSMASMAVDVADVNRDGHDDLFVGEMLARSAEERAWQRPDNLLGQVAWPTKDPRFRPEVSRSTLQLARGDGTYAEIAQFAGLAATEWTWSAGFLDVDLDGWEDLLVSTGSQHDLLHVDILAAVRDLPQGASMAEREAALGRFPLLPRPKLAFRNQRDGTFREVGQQWGFADVAVAHGMAWGDLDGDGDLDVVVNHLNSPAGLYRNDGSARFLSVRLRGVPPNTQGIGARVTVDGGPVTQSQVVVAGGRYCSHSDAMLVFACGEAESVSVRVRWPDGQQSEVTAVQPGREIQIKAPAGRARLDQTVPTVKGAWFTDESQVLQHTHRDKPFNDFHRQSLLPHRLAALGPGIVALDLDGDDQDEVMVGGGTGGEWVHLRPYAGGPDRAPTRQDTLQANLGQDQHGLAVWRESGGWRMASAFSNWDQGNAGASTVQVRDPAGSTRQELSSSPATAGPIAVADVDGDGDLDLFTGFIGLPGRWPETSPPRVHRREGAGYVVEAIPGDSRPIMGAVFTDLTGDGLPELVTTSDWGPIRIHHRQGDRWVDVSGEWGLADLHGWWRGVASGDFDGDGRLDLVAGNWGLNASLGLGKENQARWELRHADWNDDGTVQTLVGIWAENPGRMVPVRERRMVTAVLPKLAGIYPDHVAYAKASLPEMAALLGPHQVYSAQENRSLVFLNRGTRLEIRPLPMEAQWAPVFGISIADFDGDGFEDLFLAQNFFGTDPETSRQDAGTGLLLQGNGQGAFRSVRPAESGIFVEGEGRGCAVGDFNGDGRPDLVVGQHRGETRLFLGRNGSPGLRVRLSGPRENQAGIGAVLRLGAGDAWGPAREIQAGSGWWSQSSLAPCPALGRPPERIRVRWPGGIVSVHPVPAGAKTVEIPYVGSGKPGGNSPANGAVRTGHPPGP